MEIKIQSLLVLLVIAAAVVNGQDYDDSYSSWFDSQKQQYYASYYMPYYCAPPNPDYYSEWDHENAWVNNNDDDINKITRRITWGELTEDDLQEVNPEDIKILNTDLSCHPNFNTESIDWINAIIEDCKITDENCVNSCILRKLNVLTGEVERASEERSPMYSGVRNFFTQHEYIKPTIVVSRILKCWDIARALKGISCRAKINTALYECVEKAWAC